MTLAQESDQWPGLAELRAQGYLLARDDEVTTEILKEFGNSHGKHHHPTLSQPRQKIYGIV